MVAIIPTEIGIPTLRIGIPEEVNAETITKYLDMENKLRQDPAVRIVSTAKTSKLVQQASKIANIPRRRPSLEKGL